MNYLLTEASNLTIAFFAIDIALVLAACIIAIVLYVKNKNLQEARYKAKNPSFRKINDDLYLIKSDHASVKKDFKSESQVQPVQNEDNHIEHFKNQIEDLNFESNMKSVRQVKQSEKTIINSQPKSVKSKNKKYIEVNKNDKK